MNANRILFHLITAGLSSLAIAQDLYPSGALPASPEKLLAERDTIQPERQGQPAFQGSLGIRDMLREAVVQRSQDGVYWARTRSQRAAMGPDGLSVYPVFGPESPREWPIHFQLESCRRGSRQLSRTALAGPDQLEGSLRLRREEVTEQVHLGRDAIEQTFIFDALPGEGDLHVRLAVATDLDVLARGEELLFRHPDFGHVRYGRAFVLDARGQKQGIERTWNNGHIDFLVPADFLAGATYPVTIDPVIETFSSGFGIADDREPDVVWCGRTNRYLVAWEEYTSAINADVYVTSFNQDGQDQGDAIAIDQSSQNWTNPTIAYAYGPDRALVAASVDLGSDQSRVRARFVDVTAFTVEPQTVTLSTEGIDKLDVDAGGTTHNSLTNAFFSVVWSSYNAAGNSRVQYRIVNWDGTVVTPIRSLCDWADGGIQPAISAGLGDLSIPGGAYWTIVWTEDENGDGRGRIMGRRVLWDGDTEAGGGEFLINGTPQCSSPSVTSQLDDFLQTETGRPSIVAYDRMYPAAGHPNGEQRSVLAAVIVNGQAFADVAINSTLEDFDPLLDQSRPCIATDGRGFTLAYIEERWNNIGGANDDIYLVSGNIFERTNQVGLALSERHESVGATLWSEGETNICTIWDGEVSSNQDDGAILWTRDYSNPGDYGLLAGAVFDNPTDNSSDDKAIGLQYCDAYPNSVGTFGGRNSSWLWIRGEGGLSNEAYAHAVDLPANAISMLVVGSASGSIDFPAGSAGRLCLGGTFGRYVNQVQPANQGGSVNFTIDPTALPSPGGPIAALPGQSWYFQVWHRDTVAGQSTSNFTNGCRVVFEP